MAKAVAAGRMIFGVWLILLGLDNFFPFFSLSFSTDSVLPVSGSSAELSAQLIAAFRDTGLLAITAAALIVAGALIVIDRLTVLALMVPLPVFVCALYWASFLERSSPLVLLILICITVNVRLLIAYWPYVRQLLLMKTPSATDTGDDSGAFWPWAEGISRYVWAIWFVWSGTFHFYAPPIYGVQPLAAQLMIALDQSHLYELVKGVEVIGGLAVLFRRWAPLGLLANVPVTLVVMYWDGVLEGQFGALGLIIVALTFGFTAVLMRAYRSYYRPLLTWRPRFVAERIGG